MQVALSGFPKAQCCLTLASLQGTVCHSDVIDKCCNIHLALFPGMSLFKTKTLMNLGHDVTGFPCGVIHPALCKSVHPLTYTGEVQLFQNVSVIIGYVNIPVVDRSLLDRVLAKPVKAGRCRQISAYYLSDHGLYNLRKFNHSQDRFDEM